MIGPGGGEELRPDDFEVPMANLVDRECCPYPLLGLSDLPSRMAVPCPETRAIRSSEAQGIAPDCSGGFPVRFHPGRLRICVPEESDAASLQAYGCRGDQFVSAQVEYI